MPNKSRRLLPFVLAGCCTAPLWAADIQVPADHVSIQQAINAAVDGDTVLIAPGTYNEAIDFLGKAITVTSSDGAAVTVIDGAGLNASVVKFISGEGPESVLDDLTITGGTGTIGGFEYTLGGGIYVVDASPSILNCIVSANTAAVGGGVECTNGSLHLVNCTVSNNTAGSGGGGLHIHSNSTLILDVCTFEGNCSNYSGGGVYAEAPAIVNNCTFANNTAHHDDCPNPNDQRLISLAPSGGGLFCEGAAATITNSTFIGNIAYWAGGGFGSIGDATFIDCHFEKNHADLGGGGIGSFAGTIVMNGCTLVGNTAGDLGGLFVSQALQVTDCVFEANSATGNGGAAGYGANNNTTYTRCIFHANSAASGGALLIDGFNSTNQPHYLDCVFTNNVATATTVDPWLFPGGGAVRINGSAKPRFTNCLFSGNSASYGGAFLIGAEDLGGPGTTPSIVNCTLSGNTSSNGGAIFAGFNGQPSVANSILWNNGPQPIVNNGTSTTTVTFSDLQFGYAGLNNIDADPLFLSATNFTLRPDSPCIDEGNNAAVPAGVIADLAGNPRIQNDIVDMGAYETVAPCAADISPSGGNGQINVDDLLIIINGWGNCGGGSCPADVAPPGGNGVVDVDDLLLVINQWGPCE